MNDEQKLAALAVLDTTFAGLAMLAATGGFTIPSDSLRGLLQLLDGCLDEDSFHEDESGFVSFVRGLVTGPQA